MCVGSCVPFNFAKCSGPTLLLKTTYSLSEVESFEGGLLPSASATQYCNACKQVHAVQAGSGLQWHASLLLKFTE